MREYYSRLFLKDRASQDEVKKAYRKLVIKFHPDKNQNSDEYTEEFKLIQEAYDKLMAHFNRSKSQYTYKEKTKSKASSPKETDIVKSGAKYAEAIEEIPNDILYNFVMYTLIGLFVLCGIYAIINYTIEIFQL
jgi:DnaJ-class molecular chaperone